MHQLPPQKEIAEKVKAYLAVISSPSPLSIPLISEGKKLYELLVKPTSASLQSESNVIIVADGILHYLPFEALVARTEKNAPHYLVESFNISYAPSASVLGYIKEQRPPTSASKRDLLAFGDPVFGDETVVGKRKIAAQDSSLTEPISELDLYGMRGFEFKRLPHTATEVQGIVSLFSQSKGVVYLRAEAKEERLKAENLSQYRRLHFATHATLDEQMPGRSSIVLTLDDDPNEDGFLQMNEIFSLRLNADLVVLSACQTGKGKLLRGEGVVGMSRAFMYAGAKSLVVSLWSVADQSTADFMAKFYRYMSQGKTKNEALRQAKLDMIKGSDAPLRHPYFWAPFVLAGENH